MLGMASKIYDYLEEKKHFFSPFLKEKYLNDCSINAVVFALIYINLTCQHVFQVRHCFNIMLLSTVISKLLERKTMYTNISCTCL